MDLLLHNLRTIGTHHCDQTVGEEAAKEIERLRGMITRVRNFPSHPGGHPADMSDDADDAASWRHGWICAVEAMQDALAPNAELTGGCGLPQTSG